MKLTSWRWSAETIARFGRIDVLINNAALVSHSHLWPDPVWGAPWPVVRDMSLSSGTPCSRPT